jgi:hypothetical protein
LFTRDPKSNQWTKHDKIQTSLTPNLYNPKTKSKTTRPSVACRTAIKSITSSSIITDPPEKKATSTKPTKWYPNFKIPYDKINKIANNTNLTKRDIKIIANGLSNNTLIGATDGTAKEGKETGGWTLYDTNKDKIVEGSTPIPNNPTTTNSTRPERDIQISILHTILLTAQHYNIKSSKVPIYINNISSFTQTIKTPLKMDQEHT